MCLDSPGHKGSKLKLSGALGRWRRPVSIFQTVDWVASLAMVVMLGRDLCDCQCTPEIVSTKTRGETTVGGHAASNNVGRGETL